MLAVDIGTGGARAVLFDTQANQISQVRAPYPMLFPQPGWGEQNPDEIVEAVIRAMRVAVASIPSESQLEGVVFSAQMYSVLALGSDGRPLSNSLLWSDGRSAKQAAALRRTPRATGLNLITGCPLQAIYPLSKIVWLKENLDLPPAVKFVSIKDYVVFRLTGQLITDWSTASASGLLNISSHQWADEALLLSRITANQLADLVSTRHIVKGWQADVVRHIGIADGLPLIIGAGDAPLANIGVGAIEPGSLAVNVGTSAAARVLLSEPQVDPDGRLWTYVADVGKWVLGGIIGGGGAVYDWLLRKFVLSGQDLSMEQLYEQADNLAASIQAGAEELLFIPYLSGEQSPGWNPESRGLLHGMTFRHDKGHVIRAALEGITFSLLRVVKAIEEAKDDSIEEVLVTGGLTASSVWRQIIADTVGVPVVVPRSHEGSARGAAILGWLALDHEDDYLAFYPQPPHTEERLSPEAETHEVYRRRYQAFCNLNMRLQTLANHQEDNS